MLLANWLDVPDAMAFLDAFAEAVDRHKILLTCGASAVSALLERPVPLLIQQAIGPRPASAHVRPLGWYRDHRSWTVIHRRFFIESSIPVAPDDHGGDFAAVRMQRIVGVRRNNLHARERSPLRVSR